MYVKKLTIKDFRGFSADGLTIEPGIGVNCIAGYNGVGKSTILAVLGNCGELKKKDGTHINGDQFSGEYSEIIKFDSKGDSTGEKAVFEFGKSKGIPNEKLEVEKLAFRAAEQSRVIQKIEYKQVQEDTDLYEKSKSESRVSRYRLIPKKTSTRKTEKKLEWPVYYLGLSRLFPVGESSNVFKRKLKMTDECMKRFVKIYQYVLGSDEEIGPVDSITPSDSPHKKGAAIQTECYGAMANSAGQDNLGQIILTFLSFEKLKEERGPKYNGGMILIDEIDATLHPFAQKRLLDRMIKWSKENSIQVFFTTHSMFLVKEVLKKIGSADKNDSTRVHYLTKSYGELEIRQNPPFLAIRNDLNAEIGNHFEEDIPVLTEDDVARDFLKHILGSECKKLNLKYSDVHMSFIQIIDLVSSFPDFFVNSLVVLDPDASQEENRDRIEKRLSGPFMIDGDEKSTSYHLRKVLFLPGNEPIETALWNHFKDKKSSDPFYDNDEFRNLGINRNSLILESQRKAKEEGIADKDFPKYWYKTWVADLFMGLAFEDYCKAHDEEVYDFRQKFLDEYRSIRSTVQLRD